MNQEIKEELQVYGRFLECMDKQEKYTSRMMEIASMTTGSMFLLCLCLLCVRSLT
jgi:hypothetical protein